jgi:hypothetical protein
MKMAMLVTILENCILMKNKKMRMNKMKERKLLMDN